MKSLKSILALGAFFVLAVALSACGSAVPGDSVADMAGNPITTSAFNHWMYVAAKGNAAQSPGSPVIVPNDPPDFKNCVAQVRKEVQALVKQSDKQIKTACGQLFTSLGSQVMDFLIRAYWYQAEAAKQHVKVTDAQVQQAFATAKQQQFPTDAAFQTYLSQSGQTLQDILFRVRASQIFQKLEAKQHTTVTPAQVQAYYQTHRSQFGTPETRDIRIVRTSTEKQALAAKAALASGQSWDAVAKKYSIDTATKSKGGQLPGVKKGQEEQALDSAAFSASVNKVVGPVKGSFGYYVVEVTKIKPATQQTLSGQAQTNAQTAVDKKAKSDFLHKTQCRSPYAMADCSGYKAPKTSSTSTAAPATPQTPAPSTTTG
jgi:foldase protein PrsA